MRGAMGLGNVGGCGMDKAGLSPSSDVVVAGPAFYLEPPINMLCPFCLSPCRW